MLATLSQHDVGIFYVFAAVFLTVAGVVAAFTKEFYALLLAVGLAVYVWPQAINALG